jgi:hypothetical protein
VQIACVAGHIRPAASWPRLGRNYTFPSGVGPPLGAEALAFVDQPAQTIASEKCYVEAVRDAGGRLASGLAKQTCPPAAESAGAFFVQPEPPRLRKGARLPNPAKDRGHGRVGLEVQRESSLARIFSSRARCLEDGATQLNKLITRSPICREDNISAR